jgi:HKD family nuclease
MTTIELLRHGREMGARLAEDLPAARSLSIAVASAQPGALDVLDLVGWAREGRELALVAGTDAYGTELDLLRRLEGLPGVRCRIFHPLDGAAFLPRLYVLEKAKTRVAYVGSSDLSRGGLALDVATNVRIEGDPSERELERAMRLFEELFWSELAIPLADTFEAEYRTLQAVRRSALSRFPEPRDEEGLRAAVALRIGEYRARAATRRHLLVVTPKSYAACMAARSFGRKKGAEIDRYGKGDPFFFHVTGPGKGLRAMGMFVGEPYRDEAPQLRGPDGGCGPFRRRFVVIDELAKEIRTRPILESLRPGAPKHWFNGFVQDSHLLSREDFEALRAAFVRSLVEEQSARRAMR